MLGAMSRIVESALLVSNNLIIKVYYTGLPSDVVDIVHRFGLGG